MTIKLVTDNPDVVIYWIADRKENDDETSTDWACAPRRDCPGADGLDPNERVQKLIVVKYVDPNAIQMLLMNFGVEMRADQRLRTVALSGRRSAVMTAEEAIKQLDVPGAAQKDIELTVYFVVGADIRSPEHRRFRRISKVRSRR